MSRTFPGQPDDCAGLVDTCSVSAGFVARERAHRQPEQRGDEMGPQPIKLQ